MRWHRAPNLRLLANHHALQHPRIPEPERVRNVHVQGYERRIAERRRERVQVMTDFVDGAFFGFDEGVGGRVEGVFFEEETDFVTRGEEVVVADVGRVVAGGEFG